MLLNYNTIRLEYKMKVTGVIHVGAHHGEEVPIYLNNGITKIALFEPVSENFRIIQEHVSNYNADIVGYQVALGSENKEVDIHLASNNYESSSILKPKKHLELYPDITFDSTERVEVRRLDDYQLDGYNLMNIDVQGYELEVMKGSEETLKQIDYIYCEVNKAEIYENNAYIDEIDNFLSQHSFERVEFKWWEDHDWGDALYIKRSNNGN